MPAFIEWSGNGRSFFNTQQGTPAPGTQWGLGAVGLGNWRGVPLAEVLERAGISRGAVDIMPSGLDPHYVTGSPAVDYGPVRRPLPIAKAFENTILAYELNGQPLPPDNGYPVRLVVPGWVGVANIKWVGQVQVSREPLYSYWNTTSYILEGAAYPTPIPLSTQAVKSAFELASGATLPNQRQVLTGRSWSGLAPIRRVDISTDGGVSCGRPGCVGPTCRTPGCAGNTPGLRRARGATRSRRAPPTGPDEPSPRPFPSTRSATCSGRSSSSRSRCRARSDRAQRVGRGSNASDGLSRYSPYRSTRRSSRSRHLSCSVSRDTASIRVAVHADCAWRAG